MPPAGTVHPILKQKSSSKVTSDTPAAAQSTNNGGNKELDKSKHLTWDEHAIEEHDLLRGTRMKVGVFEGMCIAKLYPWCSDS